MLSNTTRRFRSIFGTLNWTLWVSLAVIIAVILCTVGTSESFKNCTHERKNEDAYRDLHESPSVVRRLVVRTRLNVTCGGDFTEKNQGALLAVITAGLVWVGYWQIRTTRAQTRAYVHVTFDETSVLVANRGSKPLIAIQVENSGQTPAFSVELDATIDIFNFQERRILRSSAPE